MTAVGAVAAQPFAASWGSRPRLDPREHLPYISLPDAAANPIDWVDVWLTQPDRPLFRATTSQEVPYWRLVVLTRFDGEQWLPPSRYTRAGLGVPGLSTASGAGKVTQSVAVEGLAGPFLPSMDRPVGIGPPVTAVDTDSGTLITNSTEHPGLTYTVDSLAGPAFSDGTCGSGTSTGPAPALAYPPELAEPLRALGGPGCAESFAAFAHDLEQRLNTGRTNVAGIPARGTSIGVLNDFLTSSQSGTLVEFAASFALAVRAAGVPSRLVVGFAPQARAGGREWKYEVYGRDVRLWVDVRLPGRGWTAYHPTPPTATTPGLAAPLVAPSPSATLPSITVSPTVATSKPVGGAALTGWNPLPVALAAASVLIGYLVAVVVVPALRRHRRRRHPVPRARGLGAWHDVLDELAHRPAQHATGRQLRTGTPASTRLLLLERCAGVDDGIQRLTRVAEACLFAATAPNETDIELAWTAATRIRRCLRRRASWHGRIRRVISWRNLRLRPTWS